MQKEKGAPGALRQWPIHMAKEAYLYGKRGLFIWQKRPIHAAKGAYSYGKRGLFIKKETGAPGARKKSNASNQEKPKHRVGGSSGLSSV